MHDWRDALMDRHPDLFTMTVFGHVIRPGRPYVDDGWREIIERAVRRILVAIGRQPDGASIAIVLIEQKLGGLRIDYRASGLSPTITAAVEEAVELAEARAECTCEVCGAEGSLRDCAGWLTTRCDSHALGRLVTPGADRTGLYITRTFSGGKWNASARIYNRALDRFIPVPSYKEEDC